MTLNSQLTSDLATFFATDEYATAVTLSPGSTYPNRNDKTVTIGGILDDQFIESNGVETLVPTLLCLTSDVVDVVHGSMVEVGTTKYKVMGKQQDGTGATTLVLEKQ